MFKSFDLLQREDIWELAGSLKELSQDLGADKVAEELAGFLSTKIKGVVLEYPYVDKDYRSTYYGFYAKKALRYETMCARLHFFTEKIVVSKTLQLSVARLQKSGPRDTNSAALQAAYAGFMVIRPTVTRTIGRTILSPAARQGFCGHTIKGSYTTHLLGERLSAQGFPFMKQPADVAVCAHVACWSILRHYSERFQNYRELLTYDISRLGALVESRNLSPSRGLTVDHAAMILANAGTHPDRFDKEKFKSPESFYRLLYSYVESGIPVFAAMNKQQHAFTIVGHGPRRSRPRKPSVKKNNDTKAGKRGFRYAWDYIQSFIVSDDNKLPYETITRTKVGKGKGSYSISDIDSFLAPMPDKVYFTSATVLRHTERLLCEPNPYGLNFELDGPRIIRHFLTSSSAYKRYVSRHSKKLPSLLVQVSLEMPMPQFIWVSEIATESTAAEGCCNFRFIFDATATFDEPRPFLLLQDSERMHLFDRVQSTDMAQVALFAKKNSAPPKLPVFKENLTEHLGTA